MGRVMQALHMLWVPFAYLFAPKWLGRKALHGTLVKMGYGGGVIPKAAMYEIADRGLAIHKMTARNMGLISKMEDLHSTMYVNAEQVVAVISEKNRRSSFLASCHFHCATLKKHGLHIEPILIDQNGKWL